LPRRTIFVSGSPVFSLHATSGKSLMIEVRELS